MHISVAGDPPPEPADAVTTVNNMIDAFWTEGC